MNLYTYKPIKSNPQIGNWFSVFREYIAVAFEVRAAKLLGNLEKSQAIREEHNDCPYLGYFVNQLIYYENNRNEYPNIDAFIPKLISSCKYLK